MPLTAAPLWQRLIDHALLSLALMIVAGRCLMNESFPTGWRITGPPPSPAMASGETSSMVLYAGALLTLLAIWLLAHLKKPAWRATTLVGPAILLLAASMISTFFASNKHTAVISAGTLISQAALALLLIQLLDAPWKQRLLLCVIAATGVTQAYRCWEQYHYDIPAVIESYNQNPDTTLAAQGIEPDSYAAAQFRERIESRDVGGYFAISNTAAAFFILTLMATLAALTTCRPSLNDWATLLGILIVLAQIVGLLLTASKGGIAAAFLTFVLAAILWWGRRFFQTYWRGSLVVALLLVLLGLALLIAYGLHTGRLPSNSLWVRWQYWVATARMIADHWLAGVGAENFGTHYPRYMDPAAPETVSNPHCLPLALWSQWGLLGILAFIWGLVAVILRIVRPAPLSIHNPTTSSLLPGRWIWIILLTIGITALRMLNSDLNMLQQPGQRTSVILIMFIVPAVIWLVTFIMMLAVTTRFTPTGPVILILGAGLLGFLLHNTIDFGFFQPGVGTLFFAATALLISLPLPTHTPAYHPQPRNALLLRIVVVAISCGGWVIALRVCQAQNCLYRAQTQALQATQTKNLQSLSLALLWAQKAAAADPVNPDCMALYGQINYLLWNIPPHQPTYFDQALIGVNKAHRDDRENFKYPQQLSEMFWAAYQADPHQPADLQQAINFSREALIRHPACAELLILHAQLVAQNHQPRAAIACLQRALAIEADFLTQQRQMYPNRHPLRPRLCPELQRQVQALLQELSHTPSKP